MDSTESITSSKPTTSSSRLEPILLWPPGAGKEFGGEFVFGPSRPQDPIVLVLSPPWRTVLVLVIERFACEDTRETKNC